MPPLKPGPAAYLRYGAAGRPVALEADGETYDLQLRLRAAPPQCRVRRTAAVSAEQQAMLDAEAQEQQAALEDQQAEDQLADGAGAAAAEGEEEAEADADEAGAEQLPADAWLDAQRAVELFADAISAHLAERADMPANSGLHRIIVRGLLLRMLVMGLRAAAFEPAVLQGKVLPALRKLVKTVVDAREAAADGEEDEAQQEQEAEAAAGEGQQEAVAQAPEAGAAVEPEAAAGGAAEAADAAAAPMAGF